MKKAAACISRNSGIRKGLSATVVVQQTIIGSKMIVMAESAILDGKVERQCRYFKAKVLDDHKSVGANNTLKNAIDGERTIVFTDRSISYFDIADYVELHITEKSKKQTTKETLKWVHISISNAKWNFVGTYHKIKKKYLQLYINEFVYKLNRESQNSFY